MIDMQDFGTRLRYRREWLGLTQTELAAKSGIDQGPISRMERSAKDPTINEVVALAKALGGDLTQLLGANISAQSKGGYAATGTKRKRRRRRTAPTIVE